MDKSSKEYKIAYARWYHRNHARLKYSIDEQVKGDNLLCYKCLQYKPIEDFDDNPSNWYRLCKDRRCKQCKKLQYEKRKIQNRHKSDIYNVLRQRFYGARDRAKRKNLEFNITLDYLIYLWNKQQGKCALSGIDMTTILYDGRTNTNVSVDRIDPSRGYTMDNVQLVCMACNQMKNDMSVSELYSFCKNIISVYENKKCVS